MEQRSAGEMLAAALDWYDAGCSVVRVAVDGSKAPLGSWKSYQRQRADRDTVARWFEGGHPGIGVVCGEVSGHLEMFELEGRAVAAGLGERLVEQLRQLGHPDLLTRVAAGYLETSPSGGIHLLYRVEGGVDGNTKLARRPGPVDPATGKSTIEALIETRGEGGFVVVAPSHGPVHPTGQAWRTLAGSPATIPTITAAERDALHLAARALDQMPAPEPVPDPPPRERRPGELTPGEDFNQRATWQEILEPHGWTVARQLADRTYWTRPGKTFGISAVTGGDRGDYLYVWSTSTDLPPDEAMSKWRAYTFLNHRGDFSASARQLRARGYGTPAPEPTRPVLTVLPGLAASGGAATENSSPDAAAANTTPAPAVTLAHSDDGNALALVDAYGHLIRYCADRGRWLQWTGKCWEWCPPGGGQVREYAKRIARALPDSTNAERRHKQKSLSALGITHTLAQAATDPRIVVTLAQLDARPYELNTPGGVVDLRTGAIRPADPAALHTRITAVAPDPDADPTRWLTFLADTFSGHPGLADYLQRLVGYSATGVIREHILPFAFGGGANGKGVFLETLRAVLGDYATTAPSGFLMARNYASHETEIARLSGARFVVCSEVNEGDRFDEAKVKMLTGGDTLTARFMRQDHFTFTPTHTLWLMGNHQPTVTAGGYSFWRRLRIIPFTNTVPPDRMVEDLQGILATEHGGAVLAWIVQGAAAYFAEGLNEPESVRAATAEYAHDQDTVSRFVEECCHVGGGHLVTTKISTFREAYEQWCRVGGEQPVSAKALGTALRTRYGVTSGSSGRYRFYRGIALLETEGDEDASSPAQRRDLA